MTALTLYLAIDLDNDGNNRNLFVWAHTAEEAALYWAEYYEEHDQGRVALREVPTKARRGAVNWDKIPRHWPRVEGKP